MTKAEHEEQQAVLKRLRRDARLLAERFGLPLQTLDAELPRVRRRYGICDEDGHIRIRLRHARTGRLLKYSALVDTLCHELAHLKHFNHGGRFELLYRRILTYAREHGIYRPTPRRPRPVGLAPVDQPSRSAGPARPGPPPRGPIQLELFP